MNIYTRYQIPTLLESNETSNEEFKHFTTKKFSPLKTSVHNMSMIVDYVVDTIVYFEAQSRFLKVKVVSNDWGADFLKRLDKSIYFLSHYYNDDVIRLRTQRKFYDRLCKMKK